MGDRKTRHDRRSLRVRRHTLQVLGWSELEQVVGNGHLVVRHEFARYASHFCHD